MVRTAIKKMKQDVMIENGTFRRGRRGRYEEGLLISIKNLQSMVAINIFDEIFPQHLTYICV